jgi:hypothetical protein
MTQYINTREYLESLYFSPTTQVTNLRAMRGKPYPDIGCRRVNSGMFLTDLRVGPSGVTGEAA